VSFGASQSVISKSHIYPLTPLPGTAYIVNNARKRSMERREGALAPRSDVTAHTLTGRHRTPAQLSAYGYARPRASTVALPNPRSAYSRAPVPNPMHVCNSQIVNSTVRACKPQITLTPPTDARAMARTDDAACLTVGIDWARYGRASIDWASVYTHLHPTYTRGASSNPKPERICPGICAGIWPRSARGLFQDL
jgi:hypothetical protein